MKKITAKFSDDKQAQEILVKLIDSVEDGPHKEELQLHFTQVFRLAWELGCTRGIKYSKETLIRDLSGNKKGEQ